MKWRGICIQGKSKGGKKPSDKQLMKKRSNLPDKEYKVLRMLTELGKSIDEHSENFNKEKTYIRLRAEEDNNWNKNTLEGINSRSDDIEKWMSDLE